MILSSRGTIHAHGLMMRALDLRREHRGLAKDRHAAPSSSENRALAPTTDRHARGLGRELECDLRCERYDLRRKDHDRLGDPCNLERRAYEGQDRVDLLDLTPAAGDRVRDQ